MSGAHSPAPWDVRPSGTLGLRIVDAAGRTVCHLPVLTRPKMDERYANVAAIKAAPAMRSALRLADTAFARLMAAGTVVDDETAGAVRAVRAALDAAEGRA